MSNAELAQKLVEFLQLESPPIALQFVQKSPEHLPKFEGVVSAGCVFWRKAEQSTFYTDASDHVNCPVGVHTMGLPMSPETQSSLMGLVVQMGEFCYLDGAEVPHIPTVSGEKSEIVYGPLAQLETEPDVVVVWVTPYQAMLLQEATKATAWAANSGTPTFGRPACAAIPAALQRGTTVLSLGCIGMRTFTEIAQDRLLAVLPRQALAELTESLQQTSTANQQMSQFYEQKKAVAS